MLFQSYVNSNYCFLKTDGIKHEKLIFLSVLYEFCFLFSPGVMNFRLKYNSRKTTSEKIFGRQNKCFMVSLTFQESQRTTKGIFVRDY